MALWSWVFYYVDETFSSRCSTSICMLDFNRREEVSHRNILSLEVGYISSRMHIIIPCALLLPWSKRWPPVLRIVSEVTFEAACLRNCVFLCAVTGKTECIMLDFWKCTISVREQWDWEQHIWIIICFTDTSQILYRVEHSQLLLSKLFLHSQYV